MSCVHIYFWLVLGKKYHRVFIKQRHLTFDNVTDQVKLTEARLLKMLFKRAPQPLLGKEQMKQNAEALAGLVSLLDIPPLLFKGNLPPPIGLEGHQSS